MPASKKAYTCKNGHTFYKSSSCRSCPKCAKEQKPVSGFIKQLSAPARRALESKKINSLADLSCYTKSEILALHGVGPSAIPKLEEALLMEGLTFKN